MATKMYCSNCGKNTHKYNDCDIPITSWGIILVNSNVKVEHSELNFDIFESNIKTDTQEDLNNIKICSELIKFLLVRRKNSIGYIEFLRGRYEVDDIDGICYLFKQMTPEEIKHISENDFDVLWRILWNNNNKKMKYMINEYNRTKLKFDKLKYGDSDVKLTLDFYVNKVIPDYQIPEWGFPKGRKSKRESDMACALREFYEETNISPNMIKIIDNINPICENLIGTNGIKYRHIYFIAEINEEYQDILNIESYTEHKFKNNGSEEIGDIKFANYDESINLIREYHYEKRNILTCLYMYYVNTISKKLNYY